LPFRRFFGCAFGFFRVRLSSGLWPAKRAPRKAAVKRSAASLAGNLSGDSLLLMKRIPMAKLLMPLPTDEELYAKNTTEQYAELGRFVVSFELMINEIRQSCIGLLSRDSTQSGFIAIPFHHGAFTAKPLIDVWRAIVVELVNPPRRPRKPDDEDVAVGIFPDDPPMLHDADGKPIHFKKDDIDIFHSVLKILQDEFMDLANKRNNLLHATWFVGFPTRADPHSAEFFISKYMTTKEGLSPRDLPKKAAELSELSHRCDIVRDWVSWIDSCLMGMDEISAVFEKGDGKSWQLKVGRRSTLP
jgi:hypothetical protein